MDLRRLLGAVVAVLALTGGLLLGPGGEGHASALTGVPDVQQTMAYPDGTIAGISCPTTSVCLAAGEANDGPVAVLRSTDGGATYSPATVPALSARLADLTCPTASRCYAAGVQTGPNYTYVPVALVSSDGGATWSEAPPVQTQQGLWGYTDVSCTTAMSCVAVGTTETAPGYSPNLPFITRTTDGGATWTQVTKVPSSAGPLSSVTCPSPALCLAGGANGVARSTDGGASWTVASSLETTALACPAPHLCVAAEDNQMYTSFDGGTTWGSGTKLNSSDVIVRVACAAVIDCTAVGYPGDRTVDTRAVLASTSDGSNWGDAPAPANLVDIGAVACPSPTTCVLGASVDTGGSAFLTQTRATPPLATLHYRLASSDGGIQAFGSATDLGSMAGQPLAAPIVGLAATPDNKGYWEVAADGGVFAFGDAGFYGSAATLKLTKPVVGIAATPDGKGYWLVAADGGVFNYGDAPFAGSAGNLALVKPVVGIAADASGKGYWLAAADGGIFNYGDASYMGSAATLPLAKPIVGIASTSDEGDGYWMVAADGGVFDYGSANFEGSAATLALSQPVVGITSDGTDRGYWMVAADGGIFNYGNAPFAGSGAGQTTAPTVGISP